MNPEQCKQAVLDAWKTFGSRDAALIASVFTEEAEWIAPKANATAIALNGPDHMIGSKAIAKFLAEDFHKVFVRDVAIDFRGIYCDGRTVILEERMRATLANGRPYDNDYCFFFELEGGRIAKVREYMDTQRGRDAIFG